MIKTKDKVDVDSATDTISMQPKTPEVLALRLAEQSSTERSEDRLQLS